MVRYLPLILFGVLLNAFAQLALKQGMRQIGHFSFRLENLTSIGLKVALNPGEEMPTLSGVWRGMNWHERETWDLVGVTFTGHPNLTRILLPDDFEGHPLQKDFPLKG